MPECRPLRNETSSLSRWGWSDLRARLRLSQTDGKGVKLWRVPVGFRGPLREEVDFGENSSFVSSDCAMDKMVLGPGEVSIPRLTYRHSNPRVGPEAGREASPGLWAWGPEWRRRREKRRQKTVASQEMSAGWHQAFFS